MIALWLRWCKNIIIMKQWSSAAFDTAGKHWGLILWANYMNRLSIDLLHFLKPPNKTTTCYQCHWRFNKLHIETQCGAVKCKTGDDRNLIMFLAAHPVAQHSILIRRRMTWYRAYPRAIYGTTSRQRNATSSVCDQGVSNTLLHPKKTQSGGCCVVVGTDWMKHRSYWTWRQSRSSVSSLSTLILPVQMGLRVGPWSFHHQPASLKMTNQTVGIKDRCKEEAILRQVVHPSIHPTQPIIVTQFTAQSIVVSGFFSIGFVVVSSFIPFQLQLLSNYCFY